jgi:hypothetical protein
MLYDRRFLASIPLPESGERRSIVNIKANHRWVLHKLNDWYLGLLPNGNPNLKSRLRSMDSEDFTSGFWELVIFKYLTQAGHNVLYDQEVEGKKPDFYWPTRGLLGDVISVSDPNYGEREETFVHELAKHLENLRLPFDFFITSFRFSGTSYHKRNILGWFQSLAEKPLTDFGDETQEYDDGETRIEFFVLPHSKGPTVKAVGMFKLNAEQTTKIVKGRIRKKVKRYMGSLVVFTCSGLGFWNLNENTLDMALYGDWQVILMKDQRAKKVTGWMQSRATNGVFNNRWDNGSPANDRLLAVVYVDRVVQEERLFLRIKVYHNPFSKPSLSTDFFPGCAHLTVSDDRGKDIKMEWVNKDLVMLEIK